FLIEPLQALAPGTRVITLLDRPELKILPARHEGYGRDPFLWLDTRNAIILLKLFSDALIEHDPARAHLYQRNYRSMLATLQGIDRQLEYGYRGMKGGSGANYHDTLQYFEQAYALKIRATLAAHPGVRADTGKLLETRARILGGEFACLLTERGHRPQALELLTGGTGINQGELDSFGTRFEPGENLYVDLMMHNTETIRRCLQGEAPQGPVHQPLTESGADPEGIRGRFILVDHNGRTVTEKDLLGKYQLIYFGYTFCPDICPTSLATTSLALDMLGERAKLLQHYFITIDPERDTVAAMKQYVKYFNDDLIGLTGTRNMIDRVARQFNARYEKILEPGRDPQLYAMDHTASVYLMAPDGRFITKFAHGITPETMVELLREHLPGE
ncbi:MAG: hypothetical protein B0D85_01360, partial [Candidatus Sedimenticola endophacoides]